MQHVAGISIRSREVSKYKLFKDPNCFHGYPFCQKPKISEQYEFL